MYFISFFSIYEFLCVSDIVLIKELMVDIKLKLRFWYMLKSKGYMNNTELYCNFRKEQDRIDVGGKIDVITGSELTISVQYHKMMGN